MEDVNKGFMIGIIITLIIVFIFTPQSMSESCPQERLVLDCADELVEQFIADHPDVCDGLCAEDNQWCIGEWTTHMMYNDTGILYYANGSVYDIIYYEESMHWHNKTYEEDNVTFLWN